MTHFDLHAFLDSMVARGLCTSAHVEQLYTVWEGVKTKFPDLMLPCCMMTDDGALMLSWTTPLVNVSVDVYPDGDCDWFSRERDTGLLFSRAGRLEVLDNEKMSARFATLCRSTPAS